MSQKRFKSIAEQLRMPLGAFGKEVGEMMNKGNKLMNLAAIEQLELTANDNILEIGMGNGFFARNILEVDKTIHYSGCDYSDEMVEESIRMNKDFVKNGQASFTSANVSDLPYRNEFFNKVFTINTIYFWDEMKTALFEIKRVLKKNGQLIISLRPKSVTDKLPVTRYGFTTFSKEDCIELLTKNGFEIENVIEKEDHDMEFFGEKYENAFMVIKSIKKTSTCSLV